MTHHATHLTSCHADRAEHADLACSLEDRQDERVHDSEQAHDHGQREQDVEDVQHRAQPGDLVVDELLARRDLRIRVGVQGLVDGCLVCRALSSLRDDKGVEVLWLGDVAIERRSGEGDAPEG